MPLKKIFRSRQPPVQHDDNSLSDWSDEENARAPNYSCEVETHVEAENQRKTLGQRLLKLTRRVSSRLSEGITTATQRVRSIKRKDKFRTQDFPSQLPEPVVRMRHKNMLAISGKKRATMYDGRLSTIFKSPNDGAGEAIFKRGRSSSITSVKSENMFSTRNTPRDFY